MSRFKYFFILICMIAFSSPGLAETTLIIATGELPPYVSAQPEQSFLTELFDEVAREMGVKFVFKFMPWKRCETSVENLEVWAAIPYVKTPEREEKFDFSEALYIKQSKFFYYSPNGKTKDIFYNDLSDLKGYRIGAVRGYYYNQMFIDAGLTIDLVTAEEQNFKKLRFGRIDLAPAIETVGWHVIRNLFPLEELGKFFTLTKSFHQGGNYLMTSKQYPDTQNLVNRFNLALEKVKKNGIYQRISDKQGIVVTY